jgi:hypothetical protein
MMATPAAGKVLWFRKVGCVQVPSSAASHMVASKVLQKELTDSDQDSDSSTHTLLCTQDRTRGGGWPKLLSCVGAGYKASRLCCPPSRVVLLCYNGENPLSSPLQEIEIDLPLLSAFSTLPAGIAPA